RVRLAITAPDSGPRPYVGGRLESRAAQVFGRVSRAALLTGPPRTESFASSTSSGHASPALASALRPEALDLRSVHAPSCLGATSMAWQTKQGPHGPKLDVAVVRRRRQPPAVRRERDAVQRLPVPEVYAEGATAGHSEDSQSFVVAGKRQHSAVGGK